MNTHFVTTGQGALACQHIRDLINAGFISGVSNIDAQIQPASLDLSLSGEIYEVEGIFLPTGREKIRDLLALLKKKKHSLEQPLQIGYTYIVRLAEQLDLPRSVYGYCSPKSSTGRVDLHVRLLANGVPRFDGVPRGYKGDLWLAIIPKSFNVLLHPTMALNQMRFFTRDTRLAEFELEIEMKRSRLVWEPHEHQPLDYGEIQTSDKDGSVILGIGLAHSHIGWKAKETGGVLDLASRTVNPEVFWEPLKMNNGHLTLKQGNFYILATHEGILLPPNIAAEIAPMDERCGEFRSHYAGFFDPGWGWGKEGEGTGDIGTLEIRPFEDLILRPRQPICKFKFERMAAVPDTVYYAASGANYTGQSGPKLSKHFAPWPLV